MKTMAPGALILEDMFNRFFEVYRGPAA